MVAHEGIDGVLFTGSAHTNATTEFLQVGPHAGETRQQILQLREFHLHTRLARPRPRGEDVENQFGAIHHPRADDGFNILALRGRQLIVEDHQRRAEFRDSQLELLDFPAAEVRRGMRPIERLR